MQHANLHRSQFLKEIKKHFPSIAKEINAERGLLHMEIAVFHCFTQKQIDLGNREAVSLCFEIAVKYFLHGNAEMKNAVDVSFVEGLNFKGKNPERRWAWSQMPATLKQLYVEFHGYPE